MPTHSAYPVEAHFSLSEGSCILAETGTAPALFPASWRPSPLKEILNRQYVPPPWVLRDLLPKSAGLLCSGLPHASKSLSWLAACIESVTHHKVWGRFDASSVKRALFIETEDPPWLVEDRVRGIADGLGLKSHDLNDLGFGLACTGPFNLVAEQIKLAKLIESFEPDWVVLSTLQGLIQGLDWNEQKDMGAVNAALVRLQRLCPLVNITHSPRGGQRRAAGSITQDANYLTLMHFEKQLRNGHTYINVEGDSKMGSELLFDLRLNISDINDGDTTRTQVKGVVYEYESLSKKERVIEAIVQHPTADASAIAIICDCSERYVFTIIKELKGKRENLT